MSKRNRHQRRRHPPRRNREWLFRVIVLLGQATYSVVRIWEFFSRE